MITGGEIEANGMVNKSNKNPFITSKFIYIHAFIILSATHSDTDVTNQLLQRRLFDLSSPNAASGAEPIVTLVLFSNIKTKLKKNK